jgi:hypothetical protein
MVVRLALMVRALRILAAACMIVGLSGCGTAANANRSFGSGALVQEIATRLAQADSIAYTADFSGVNSTDVTLAHAPDPDRTAYSFPGGLVLLLPAGTTSCTITKTSASTTSASKTSASTTSAKCGLGSTATGTDPSSSVDTTLEQAGMIRPEAVIVLLNQTALDADAIVTDTDRTLAGTNATCIAVTGIAVADQFSVCVTTDGLLGAFTGTVAGVHLDLELDRFVLAANASAFDLPYGVTF